MKITDIYKVEWNSRVSYAGGLRNERKFNLGDNIFFDNGYGIFRGKVIGIELPPSQNPEYTYKIHIPEGAIDETVYKNGDTIEMDCATMFNSIDEAKESAVKKLELLYKLQKEKIETYFGQFK